jgi:hypothetical protein
MQEKPSSGKLWWFVIAAFLLLFTAWGVMFYIANTHPVQRIEIQQPE